MYFCYHLESVKVSNSALFSKFLLRLSVNISLVIFLSSAFLSKQLTSMIKYGGKAMYRRSKELATRVNNNSNNLFSFDYSSLSRIKNISFQSKQSISIKKKILFSRLNAC